MTKNEANAGRPRTYYHASGTPGITALTPRASNHGVPLVYLSEKRENVLVYLSNAVERFCRETGYWHEGSFYKWASYGFTGEGILRLEEYYPNATEETYKGVSGYIYSAKEIPGAKVQEDIPWAYTTPERVTVTDCEYVPDAYEAIMDAVHEGKILLVRYEDNSPKMLEWIKNITRQELLEWEKKGEHPEYIYFLKSKFNI